MFHQNLSFDTFEAFCNEFLLHFQCCLSPFSLFVDLFDLPFLQNVRSKFFSRTESPYQKHGEVTPPPTHRSYLSIVTFIH